MISSVTKPEKKDTVVWPSFVAPFQLPLLRRSNYDRKKKDSLLRPKKKSSSRLSGGCAIVVCLAGEQSLLRPEKKVLVVCLAGARSLLRPEKNKVLVVCLAGVQSLLRPEKTSSSRLSGGCAIAITTGKKKF